MKTSPSLLYNTFTRLSSSFYPFSSFSETSSTSSILETLDSLLWLETDYSKEPLSTLPPQFEPHLYEWKDWITPPLDQGLCGSCWAFSSSSTFTDRFNIWAAQKYHSESLSPVLSILCNNILDIIYNDVPVSSIPWLLYSYHQYNTSKNASCHGNSIIIAFLYIQLFGITPLSCFPYQENKYDVDVIHNYLGFRNVFMTDSISIDTPLRNLNEYNTDQFLHLPETTCYYFNTRSNYPFSYCSDLVSPTALLYQGQPAQHFKILSFYTIQSDPTTHYPRQEWIQYEIWKFGPICTSFLVYEDFYTFDPKKDKVYIHPFDSSQTPIGGHAVEIVGWGEIQKIPFWWIKNSFGSQYAQQGYFRFLRGQNQCGIEQNIICCIPNLFMNHSSIPPFIQSLLKSRVFKVRPSFSPSFFMDTVMRLLQTNGIISHSQLSKDDLHSLFQSFGTSFSEIIPFLSPSLIQSNDNVTYPSGFTKQTIQTMPSLDYSIPSSIHMPFLIDSFLASSLPSSTTSLSISPPFTTSWMFASVLFLLFLSILFLIIFLIKKK